MNKLDQYLYSRGCILLGLTKTSETFKMAGLPRHLKEKVKKRMAKSPLPQQPWHDDVHKDLLLKDEMWSQHAVKGIQDPAQKDMVQRKLMANLLGQRSPDGRSTAKSYFGRDVKREGLFPSGRQHSGFEAPPWRGGAHWSLMDDYLGKLYG